MADMGCPLLGDGKYGNGEKNRGYGETRQALYSYKLTFDLPTDAGISNYLRGRTFQVDGYRSGRNILAECINRANVDNVRTVQYNAYMDGNGLYCSVYGAQKGKSV